jgi:hypothetical protein
MTSLRHWQHGPVRKYRQARQSLCTLFIDGTLALLIQHPPTFHPPFARCAAGTAATAEITKTVVELRHLLHADASGSIRTEAAHLD